MRRMDWLRYHRDPTERPLFAVRGVSGLLGAAPADAQVNVTGTWQPKTWTLRISLRQEGNRVWGFGGQKDFWFREQWDGDRLVLVANNFEEKRKDRCQPRGVFTLSGKTVSLLDSISFQSDTGRTAGRSMGASCSSHPTPIRCRERSGRSSRGGYALDVWLTSS
jgi:hypothetical protein